MFTLYDLIHDLRRFGFEYLKQIVAFARISFVVALTGAPNISLVFVSTLLIQRRRCGFLFMVAV